MYYVINVTHRTAKTVASFVITTEGAALLAALSTPSAQELISHASLFVPGDLTLMKLEKWVDEATYQAYVAANSVALAAYTTARDAYNTANSSVHQETMFTSDVDLL